MPLALLVLLLVPALQQTARAEQVRVAKVYDGDTVRLRDGRTVRLYGIDTPETGHDGNSAQYGAERAKAMLERLVARTELRLENAPQGRDHYDRVIGLLSLPDGRVINELLLAAGLGYWYPHPSKNRAPWLQERFLPLQRLAIEQGRGVWRHVLALPEWTRPVIGNSRSLRFFSQGCDGARDISRRNRVRFVNAGEAFAAGYAPARHCGLWPFE